MSFNQQHNIIMKMIRRLLNYFCRTTTNNIYNNNNNTTNNSEPHNGIGLERTIEWSQTIPFIPPITQGIVIKVYDGDTITIAAKLPYEKSELYRFSVRLNGIDAPEIKGKTEDEKNAAHISQKALEKLILHKNVILKNTNTEKYGRILADVYLERAEAEGAGERLNSGVRGSCDDLHLNQWLLDHKLAVPYNGKTKQIPASWIEYQETTKP